MNDLFGASARGAQVSYSGGAGVSRAGMEEERGGEDLVGTLQGCLLRSLACSSPAGQVGRGVRNLDYDTTTVGFAVGATFFPSPRRESAEICRVHFFLFVLFLAPCRARAVLSVRYNSGSRHRRIMLFRPESFFFSEMLRNAITGVYT